MSPLASGIARPQRHHNKFVTCGPCGIRGRSPQGNIDEGRWARIMAEKIIST